MKALVLLLFVTLTPALAHFEIGTYEGTNNLGMKCSIDFVKKTYLAKIKNPINERVVVKVHKYGVFIVGHQAKISSETRQVLADKERLTGAIGLKKSAIALEIKMDHVNNAPDSYNVIVHNWKFDKSIMYTCSDLEFIEVNQL